MRRVKFDCLIKFFILGKNVQHLHNEGPSKQFKTFLIQNYLQNIDGDLQDIKNRKKKSTNAITL